MESKEQLFEVIEKMGHDRQNYLNEFFKCIPEAIVHEITYAECYKNEYILQAGFPCETVYILLQGRVCGLDHQKMGRVYSFLDFTKMYIIGDFELFSDLSEYGVSIRAMEHCKLLKISSKSYLNWIQHDENAMFLRLKNILSILTFERKFDREYIYMGCKERLVYFLINFYEKEKQERRMKVKFEKTQTELADKIGFNKRSVQRSIASLEKENLITVENGKITVSHEQYLRLKQNKEKESKNDKI